MSNQLKDHIDAPILKATVGLNLLGFKTIFSCCGFDYQNPCVPKKHVLNKPYFFIEYSIGDSGRWISHAKSLLFDLCIDSGWKFDKISDGSIIDFYSYSQEWDREHPFGREGSPHRYEQPCLAIDRLLKSISSLRSNFMPEAVIKDGNGAYIKAYKYWQYQPCEDWLVSPDTFDSLQS